MTVRARRGLEAFLSRRAPPARDWRGTLELPDGALPLLVRIHPTARRLTLRLAPDGSEARVSVPRGVPLTEGAAFARSRTGWLAMQKARVPETRLPGAGDSVKFRGRDLTIAWQSGTPRTPSLIGSVLRLGGPEDTVGRRVARWLEREGLALCEGDLRHFCAAAGVAAPALRLSRAQRRWGSCSSGGTVRINWRLAMAPDFVRRSVVAHEVAHLVHFDHSREFHALLARIFDGDLAAADRWLKREGRSLYAPFG